MVDFAINSLGVSLFGLLGSISAGSRLCTLKGHSFGIADACSCGSRLQTFAY